MSVNDDTDGRYVKVQDQPKSFEPGASIQMTAKEAAWLQLVPGLVSLPVFAVLAWLLTSRGLPNMMALGLTILLVEVPVSWAIMRRRVRKETGGRFSLASAFPWHASVPWWQYPVIGLPVILFSTIMMLGVGPKIEHALLSRVFSWAPDWFVMSADPSMFTEMSQTVLLAMWGLSGVGMILVGGFTQELYSRGFLLPRTEQLGRWAPPLNAVVFSVFHLIAPWGWPAFFLLSLPWAYLVWWRRSIKIGLFCHVGMLALQWLGMTAVVFGLVSIPG